MEEISILFENAARFAFQKGLQRFVRFLDPAQVHEAKRIAKQHGVAFSSWGGYDRAERVVGCFHSFDEEIEKQQFPLACLSASFTSKFCQITHRDLLGAFMALGLTRDCIGDIIIVSDHIYLFVAEHVAGFIAGSLTSAGRISLHFEVVDGVPDIPSPKGTCFSAVVSSLRLDAMLAAAYRLSRSEASDMIRNGLVKVNHIQETRTDFLLQEDTLLSLRGGGRIRFVSINGITKKQRIGITFFRYE